MATYSKTFTANSVREELDALKQAQSAFDTEAGVASAAAGIFTWFSLIGAGFIAVPPGILASVLSAYFNEIRRACTTTIDELNWVKDNLYPPGSFDIVECEVTYTTARADGQDYVILTDFRVVKGHVHGGTGWVVF